MTLPALLSKLSGRTPRFVTVDGKIVSGSGVIFTGDDYVDATFGPVTPVPKHTFHGGTDPRVWDAATPWWETEVTAVEHERTNMARAFPAFTEIVKEGRRGWSGTIDSGRGKFVIEVLHWPNKALPTIEVLHPRRLERPVGRRMRGAPHRYTSGLICVAASEDWDPSRHDAVTAIAWAAHWLAAYTEWRINLKWPEEGVLVEAR